MDSGEPHGDEWDPENEKLPDMLLKKSMEMLNKLEKQGNLHGAPPPGAYAVAIQNTVTVMPIKNGFIVKYHEIPADGLPQIPIPVNFFCAEILDVQRAMVAAVESMIAIEKKFKPMVINL